MGLLMISETINDICKVSHSFSNEEKEFIVQFAFKTSNLSCSLLSRLRTKNLQIS